ncbi:MAG: hypothetical protein J0L61_02215, partial [Planctomycetes bacterium]|nr:hypothetical protein [Planctomycetota bacterium]
LPGEYSLLVRATRKYTFGSIYADLVMNDGQMETDAESVPGPFVADNSLMTAIRLRMEGLGTLSPPSDPNREIWLFIHGRNDSPGLVGSSTYSNPMGRLIRAVQAAESIHSADPLTLALDWSEGARDNDNRGPDDNAATRFGGSRWIPTVAEWAAGELLMRGIEGPQLRVVAHSWGTYVAHLIGVRMKEIPVYDGSSGATLSTSKMLAALCAIDPAESVANYIGTSWVGSPQPKDTNYTLSAAMSWAFLTSVWAGDKPVVRSAHSSLDAGVQGANTRDSHSNGLELLASAMERLRQGPPDADDSLLRECSLMMLGGDAPGTFAGLSNSGSRDGTLDGVLFGAREAIRGSYGSGGPEEEVWRPVSLYQLDTRGRAKLDTFQGAAPRSFNLTRSAAVSLAPGQSSRAVVDRAVTQLWFRVDNPQGLERIILDSHGPGDTPDLLVGFGTPDPRSPLINLPLLEVESQNGRRVLTLRNPAPAGRALWFQVKAPARDVGVLFTLTPGSAP